MIAQLLFTALLTTISLMAFGQLRQIPLVGVAVICAALFGIYLVWMPDQATLIAHLIGVGRGTDLVLYVWVMISSAVLLILYLKSRAQFEVITALARAIALSEQRRDAQREVALFESKPMARKSRNERRRK
jgi:hypothetical protein